MTALLLLLHMLVAVALLGAITHQAGSFLRKAGRLPRSFAGKYVAVSSSAFPNAVMLLYVADILLGSVIYPAYRTDARVALEELNLMGLVGLFELKEHFGGIGLAALPLYASYWKADADDRVGRAAMTFLLFFIIWFDFISGHIINNVRGL